MRSAKPPRESLSNDASVSYDGDVVRIEVGRGEVELAVPVHIRCRDEVGARAHRDGRRRRGGERPQSVSQQYGDAGRVARRDRQIHGSVTIEISRSDPVRLVAGARAGRGEVVELFTFDAAQGVDVVLGRVRQRQVEVAIPVQVDAGDGGQVRAARDESRAEAAGAIALDNPDPAVRQDGEIERAVLVPVARRNRTRPAAPRGPPARLMGEPAVGLNAPAPFPRRMETSLEPVLATARSAFPSRFQSPVTSARGFVPTDTGDAVNIPVPSFCNSVT